MEQHGDMTDALARRLFDTIEDVRLDMALVEFWAGAVSGFAKPVPAYDPGDAGVWLPREQAASLRPTDLD